MRLGIFWVDFDGLSEMVLGFIILGFLDERSVRTEPFTAREQFGETVVGPSVRTVDLDGGFVVSFRWVVFVWRLENACEIEVGLDIVLVLIRVFLVVYLGFVEISTALEVMGKVIVGEREIWLDFKSPEKMLLCRSGVFAGGQDSGEMVVGFGMLGVESHGFLQVLPSFPFFSRLG